MSEPLLSVRDLAVDFRVPGRAEPVHAVRGVSFDIAKGETVALVGESGSGKSVTALSILQLLPYPAASHPSGSIALDGQELVRAPEATMRRVRGNRVAMVFQEPMTSLNPLHTVERQVSETLILHKGLDRTAARARTLELLELVGLRDAERRLAAYPDELSGGQRQRVWIAMALAQGTDLLLLDEPTTYLDVAHQVEMLDLLADLNARRGTTVVMVLHDLNLAARYADHLVALRHGRVVAAGAPAEVVTEDVVRTVFGLENRVIEDPVSHTPLVVPVGRHRPRPAGPRPSAPSSQENR